MGYCPVPPSLKETLYDYGLFRSKLKTLLSIKAINLPCFPLSHCCFPLDEIWHLRNTFPVICRYYYLSEVLQILSDSLVCNDDALDDVFFSSATELHPHHITSVARNKEVIHQYFPDHHKSHICFFLLRAWFCLKWSVWWFG